MTRLLIAIAAWYLRRQTWVVWTPEEAAYERADAYAEAADRWFQWGIQHGRGLEKVGQKQVGQRPRRRLKRKR